MFYLQVEVVELNWYVVAKLVIKLIWPGLRFSDRRRGSLKNRKSIIKIMSHAVKQRPWCMA